ncbi:Hypothetical protein R9X50_00603100 [Acrodontium crateriforme]|uniref:Uncharacterized protein n=1 Tax=Acrodontium crateriforme TaxID=150365 RepID=A0AAQ3M920_9PEZI|nr:Hypothetical protein R9X50_00603100 [Acrodontium crateriforme]
MERLLDILRRPGAKTEVVGVATTQNLDLLEKDGSVDVAKSGSVMGYENKKKARLLDRWLDWVVDVSGSEVVFLTILASLLTWALVGIKYHHVLDWQIVISDVQAILSYFFDSLLMRQQLNTHAISLDVCAELRSRSLTNRRMLETLVSEMDDNELASMCLLSENPSTPEFEQSLPKEKLFGRVSTFASEVLGHILFIAIFWICMVIWLAFGPANHWSDVWQLDINSGTSALMVLVFAFLANIRERHSDYSLKCLDATFRVDSALEAKLRLLTGDKLENDTVIIPAPRVRALQRAINYYADVVGTLVGIAILLVVTVVWIAIGPIMHFSSNWWLIIGTYAGLIGLNDGFVLRNVQARLNDHESLEFSKVETDDAAMFAAARIPLPEKTHMNNNTLTYRVSTAMNRVCAHEITVVIGFLFVLGLLCGSSAMGWNTTGQLLSNVPPSIVESFFMIILITGHNFSEASRRADLKDIYERRLKLVAFVNVVKKSERIVV